MSANLIRVCLLFVATLCAMRTSWSAETPRSHSPLRPFPRPSERPPSKGTGYYVDSLKGDDTQAGTEQHPWKTVQHGVLQLKAGDTLYLRGGAYYENVQMRGVGRPDAAITIRSYPGELATLDGSLREIGRAHV